MLARRQPAAWWLLPWAYFVVIGDGVVAGARQGIMVLQQPAGKPRMVERAARCRIRREGVGSLGCEERFLQPPRRALEMRAA
jgi:hypothetical protein